MQSAVDKSGIREEIQNRRARNSSEDPRASVIGLLAGTSTNELKSQLNAKSAPKKTRKQVVYEWLEYPDRSLEGFTIMFVIFAAILLSVAIIVMESRRKISLRKYAGT